MPKREVTSDLIRKPSGVFSQATVVEAEGRLVFISGMTARRPDGTIAGIRFSISGIVGGQPVFVINHVTRMRADIGPDWPTVGDAGGYRVEIDSYPPFVGDFPMALPGGTGSSFADAMAMTAARCVNAIDAIVAATPGYKTFLDLKPLVGQHTIKLPRPAGAR